MSEEVEARINKIKHHVKIIDRSITVIELELGELKKLIGLDAELEGKLDEVIRKWIEWKAVFNYIVRKHRLKKA